MHAMDLTQPAIETLLREIKPHFVFFDFTHWLPALARKLGIKSVHYCIISPAAVGYLFREEPNFEALMKPPSGFPKSEIKLYEHEARALSINNVKEFGCGVNFLQRMIMTVDECDAMGFKSCREIEARLKKEQFHELVLGFELTGFPFFAALKPPIGAETVEEALTEGFTERTKERGVVYGGWVQQQLILSHPSIGCFVTHCGWGSLSEAMNDGGDLRVGVEVEKGDEDGLFTRDGVMKAIRLVMDDDSEIGKEIRANHAKWRDFLLREGLENTYVDDFVHKLQSLLEH
ncbi:hypothetical protein DH2020_009000 [Rehmannia glutinosa]|uniref:Uncharacterized protein n=1 Tax=Rehmannia glutinosa TaxID=99300 RepID=A0ABR0X806_REHGL